MLSDSGNGNPPAPTSFSPRTTSSSSDFPFATDPRIETGGGVATVDREPDELVPPDRDSVDAPSCEGVIGRLQANPTGMTVLDESDRGVGWTRGGP